jgi:hypothetical protein
MPGGKFSRNFPFNDGAIGHTHRIAAARQEAPE